MCSTTEEFGLHRLAMSIEQNLSKISNRNIYQNQPNPMFDCQTYSNINRTLPEFSFDRTQSNTNGQSKFTAFSMFDCFWQSNINRLIEFDWFVNRAISSIDIAWSY